MYKQRGLLVTGKYYNVTGRGDGMRRATLTIIVARAFLRRILRPERVARG
jgi:hypothetical protein